MLTVFHRGVKKSGEVVVSVVSMVDGETISHGHLYFPTKQIWTKFIGAIQRGAIEVPDLEVRLENMVMGEEERTEQRTEQQLEEGRMPSLSQTLMGDPVRALIYGVSGSGKTSLVGMSVMQEGFYPLYVFDWDLRIASLRARLPKEYWDRVVSDPYRDVKNQGEAYTIMQAKVERLESDGYKAVCIDSGTFCLLGIMARVLMLDGKTATNTPQLQNYLQQQSLFKESIGRLCSKKLHVFVNCHEDTTKDEVTGRLFKAVDLTGKLANQIPGYFNELWHTEVTQTTGQPPSYSVRTRSDMVYGARTSFRSLDTVERQELVWPKIVQELNQKEGR